MAVDWTANQERLGKALGNLYREWGKQCDIIRDRGKSLAERQAACAWINVNLGFDLRYETAEWVEQFARELGASL